MSNIKLLSDSLINKIAAGEVVDRPASVVKELVENALDADATKIIVELGEGGCDRISVIDDGKGIDPQDLGVALRRHATSKISQDEDLFQIGTLGFRGEALASITAVSRFSMQSRQPNTASGAMIEGEGSSVSQVLPWAGAVGTSVHIRDLFFNIPARKSFLKSVKSEYSRCMELIHAFSLSHPEVEFVLRHNSKEKFCAKKVNDALNIEESLRQRASEVFSSEVAKHLIFVERPSKYGRVHALMSTPGHEKSNSKGMFFFVNGRWVKDKLLHFAVTRGYHSHLLKGKYPVVILHYQTDPSLIDVNVHPAKNELRFQYDTEVQASIALVLREALRSGAWAQMPVSSTVLAPPSPEFVPTAFSSVTNKSDLNLGSYSSDFSSPKPWSPPRDQYRPTRDVGKFTASEPTLFSHQVVKNEQVVTPEDVPWSQLTYLGSFAKCYLLFEVSERLLAVDQHAFHERVLYERLNNDDSLLKQKQSLLIPEEVELSAEQVAFLTENQDLFLDMGFEYSPVSDNTVELKSVPAILKNRDPAEILDLASQSCLSEFDGTRIEGLAQNILATFACHAAVRSGEELGPNELKSLLAEASSVDFFHNCPHGRRVFRWWDVSQVARWFDR